MAGLVLESFTAASMLGNPVFGVLSKSSDRHVLCGISAALALVGFLPIAIAPSWAPFVVVPICEFGLGGAFTLGVTLPLDNTQTADEASVGRCRAHRWLPRRRRGATSARSS